MTLSLDAALSGMIEQERNLELIANNLTNVNTTGYKRAVVQFQDVLNTAEIIDAINGQLPADEATVTAGVGTDAPRREFTQGPLLASSMPFDMAIVGEGFFRVMLEDGTVAYTRDGTFRLDADRQLVTARGQRLEPPLTLPESFDQFRVEQDGTVVVRRPYTADELADLDPDAPTGGVVEVVGRLVLTRFADQGSLASIGHNLFVETEASQAPIDGFPGEDGRGQAVSGFLEGSNVDLAQEMSAMVIANRAYQLNLAAYRTIQEMLEQANELA